MICLEAGTHNAAHRILGLKSVMNSIRRQGYVVTGREDEEPSLPATRGLCAQDLRHWWLRAYAASLATCARTSFLLGPRITSAQRAETGRVSIPKLRVIRPSPSSCRRSRHWLPSACLFAWQRWSRRLNGRGNRGMFQYVGEGTLDDRRAATRPLPDPGRTNTSCVRQLRLRRADRRRVLLQRQASSTRRH